QDWLPFGLALGYVVVHPSLLGLLAPHDVFNHAAAVRSPWKWALIHGAFGLAASVAYLVNWRLSERQAIEISRLVSRLEGLARTDPLTGAPNPRRPPRGLPGARDPPAGQPPRGPGPDRPPHRGAQPAGSPSGTSRRPAPTWSSGPTRPS